MAGLEDSAKSRDRIIDMYRYLGNPILFSRSRSSFLGKIQPFHSPEHNQSSVMGLSPVLNTFIGYSGGLESDWNFCFESYGTKFEISTVTESCGETERFYLDSLQQAIKAHNDSAEATIIDEVADWLAELCQP